jgi:hypothetical protein
MLTDRLVKLFLGAIAVLLLALVLQGMFRSSAEAKPGLYTGDNTSQIYDVRGVADIAVSGVQSVTPLVVNPETSTASFALVTKERVLVYRLAYYSTGATQ